MVVERAESGGRQLNSTTLNNKHDKHHTTIRRCAASDALAKSEREHVPADGQNSPCGRPCIA